MLRHNAPMPNLCILPVERLHAHELHDSQRSDPLIERLRHDTLMINPPLVAAMDDENFVVLDGANRVHGFATLEFPHILAQVVDYATDLVTLDTWQHVISDWNSTALLNQIAALPSIEVRDEHTAHAITHIHLPDQRLLAITAPDDSVQARNAALCQVVMLYQRHAKLNRTTLPDISAVWDLFPTAFALVTFPLYQPADIITAAREQAYLPPGVSRHIVQGRALRVNYPLEILRDRNQSLDAKNADLRVWLQSKLAHRQVRYYAEATYQFDE